MLFEVFLLLARSTWTYILQFSLFLFILVVIERIDIIIVLEVLRLVIVELFVGTPFHALSLARPVMTHSLQASAFTTLIILVALLLDCWRGHTQALGETLGSLILPHLGHVLLRGTRRARSSQIALCPPAMSSILLLKLLSAHSKLTYHSVCLVHVDRLERAVRFKFVRPAKGDHSKAVLVAVVEQ